MCIDEIEVSPSWGSGEYPAWANYLAMDDCGGVWRWFQFRPINTGLKWESVGGESEFAGKTCLAAGAVIMNKEHWVTK